ncbi:hypothetical protein MC885_010653 [Smutsia gigantea]|nr:hypothetical protein MC885_010653 [Smutsia gigantea]
MLVFVSHSSICLCISCRANAIGIRYPKIHTLHGYLFSSTEIEKFQKGEGKDEEKYIDVVINKNMKLGQKVLIPVKQFPKFNFVGKLLGPRGNSLKRLQEETLTKMSILGKGSMRDKAKEEELRKSGEAKYFHLNDDLHVLIEVFAPPAEAYARMGHALEEIKKFLIPVSMVFLDSYFVL